MASLNEVKAIAENMEYQSGRIMSQDDVAKLLSDHHLKKIKDAGFISMDSAEFTSQTKRNYSALIASQGNVSISKTSTVKTTTRFAAENSIHACIRNLALIGSTHFIPVQYEDSDTSEVQSKMIFMGHQISSCHVPVVRSFFIFWKTLLSS